MKRQSVERTVVVLSCSVNALLGCHDLITDSPTDIEICSSKHYVKARVCLGVELK